MFLSCPARNSSNLLTMNQIGHHRRQPIKLALCPAVFDRHVAAFNVTVFAQAFEKGRQSLSRTRGRKGIEMTNHRHCRRLLRMGSEWPCCRRAAISTFGLAVGAACAFSLNNRNLIAKPLAR